MGLLQARLPELALDEVPDPRAREGRWSLAQIAPSHAAGAHGGMSQPAGRRGADLDGKVTAVPAINQPLVQTQHPEVGLPYGLIRTVTAALVSAPGRPCIDAIPIPTGTNEVGFFQTAFRELLAVHGALFDLVSYDAGGFSRNNADAVVAAGKHYLFALKDETRAMCRLADELLVTEPVLARTEDVP